MADTNTADNSPPAETSKEAPVVEFTPEQQAKLDEIISERINKANAKHAQEMKAVEDRHRKDLERSRMDEADRLKAEEAERIDGLTKRAEEAERRLAVAAVERELAKSNLPAELAPFVMGADDDATASNIRLLDKAVQERANRIYADKVAKGAPRAPKGEGQGKGSELYAAMREAANL